MNHTRAAQHLGQQLPHTTAEGLSKYPGEQALFPGCRGRREEGSPGWQQSLNQLELRCLRWRHTPHLRRVVNFCRRGGWHPRMRKGRELLYCCQTLALIRPDEPGQTVGAPKGALKRLLAPVSLPFSPLYFPTLCMTHPRLASVLVLDLDHVFYKVPHG